MASTPPSDHPWRRRLLDRRWPGRPHAAPAGDGAAPAKRNVTHGDERCGLCGERLWSAPYAVWPVCLYCGPTKPPGGPSVESPLDG